MPRRELSIPDPWPTCPTCKRRAAFFLDSRPVFDGRNRGPVYACLGCDTRVGCHKGTTLPLGTLADAETRQARGRAHMTFDPLWRAKMARDGLAKGEARDAAYAWLAGRLGIPVERCHMALFDAERCGRVVEICRPYAQSIRRAGLAG